MDNNSMKITTAAYSRFSNAEHAQFHSRAKGLIASGPADLAKLHIDDSLIQEWQQLIDQEIEINRQVQAEESTRLLAEKDRERDLLITYYFAAIRAAALAPFAPMGDAGKRLALIVDKYTGLQVEAGNVETLHLNGFIVDISKSAEAADLATLHLQDAAARLTAANDAYSALLTSRTTTRAANLLPQAGQIRHKADDIYARVCQLIEVGAILAATPAERTAVGELIDQLNQLIVEIRTMYRQSRAQKSKPAAGDAVK